ncbi:hypothetical protein [Halocella sp. SP3-1]|uniref:hypothetical protein n=1 Tax=Halocella sp. SP3-1 TaxID=2382161 RepID=UPI000F7658F3|nr:hypothetical protein [Halocella sp. SP3-1]AZO96173.1 hypothetical protein D7D81_17115 [Halocella sp. SP3-1]
MGMDFYAEISDKIDENGDNLRAPDKLYEGIVLVECLGNSSFRAKYYFDFICDLGYMIIGDVVSPDYVEEIYQEMKRYIQDEWTEADEDYYGISSTGVYNLLKWFEVIAKNKFQIYVSS